MRYLLLVIAAATIVACGSSSGLSSYRPAGYTGAAWTVKAEKNKLTDKVHVFVNDSLVCAGSIGLFSSGEEIKGEYRGHKVVAMLQKTRSFLSEGFTCLVMIDGEIAGKFEL